MVGGTLLLAMTFLNCCKCPARRAPTGFYGFPYPMPTIQSLVAARTRVVQVLLLQRHRSDGGNRTLNGQDRAGQIRRPSSFEKESPEKPASLRTSVTCAGLVRCGVRNQVGQQQADRGVAAQAVGHVSPFRGGDDVVVSAVKQEDRHGGR